jgi:TM2 domain-containing membrane protein YozV
MADTTDQSFQPVAAIAACIFPGAGHFVLGQVKRGVLIAIGILFLFFGGIFIGGIDVIDSKEDRVWFLGQALVGPIAFGVDYVHQEHFKVREYGLDNKGNPVLRGTRSAYPNEGRNPKTGEAVAGQIPPNSKSVGKVNELGTLFAAVAGMLNLIAIIDAAAPTRRQRSAGDEAGAGVAKEKKE